MVSFWMTTVWLMLLTTALSALWIVYRVEQVINAAQNMGMLR